MKNLISCGTCGYPLTPEERTSLVEQEGVMVKPTSVVPDVMTKDKALDLALEALTPFSTPNWAGTGVDKANEAITAIKQARSAPVQDQIRAITQEAMQKIHDLEDQVRREVYNIPPALVVPDVLTTAEGEHPEYVQGWNDCRQLMLQKRNNRHD